MPCSRYLVYLQSVKKVDTVEIELLEYLLDLAEGIWKNGQEALQCNQNSHITSLPTSTVIQPGRLPISSILEPETESSSSPVFNPTTLDEDKQVTEPTELMEDTKKLGNEDRDKRIFELSKDHSLSWEEIAQIVGAEFNEELSAKATEKAAKRYAKKNGFQYQSRNSGRKSKRR